MSNRRLLWQAWLNLKLLHKRPSETLNDDLEPLDSVTAYCVDNVVLWFGIATENALQERVKVGMGKEAQWEAKYTLDELLDSAFRMPRPLPAPKTLAAKSGIDGLMALVGNGVKAWNYVGAKPS